LYFTAIVYLVELYSLVSDWTYYVLSKEPTITSLSLHNLVYYMILNLHLLEKEEPFERCFY